MNRNRGRVRRAICSRRRRVSFSGEGSALFSTSLHDGRHGNRPLFPVRIVRLPTSLWPRGPGCQSFLTPRTFAASSQSKRAGRRATDNVDSRQWAVNAGGRYTRTRQHSGTRLIGFVGEKIGFFRVNNSGAPAEDPRGRLGNVPRVLTT